MSHHAQRGVSRRDVIKAAAAAGTVAWTTPTIVDSVANPAAAATREPCPTVPSHVVLYSPPGSRDLVDRPGAWDAGGSVGRCSFNGPGPACEPLYSNRTTAAAIGLQVSRINVSHDITNLNTQNVTLTLDPLSCCTITRVRAHVHRFGQPVFPHDCPSPYCQEATVGGTYFQVVAGGYGTKSVTVRPNRQSQVCPAGRAEDGRRVPATGVHWGSPNTDSDCNTANGPDRFGQPYGYLLIDIDCGDSAP